MAALVVGCCVGFYAGWRSRQGSISAQQSATEELRAENKRLQAEALATGKQASAHEATAAAERSRAERLEAELAEERTARQAAEDQAARFETQLADERKQSAENLALLSEARQELSNQFKSLANDILEEKSKRFTEQNQANIGQLLVPLREKIAEFQRKVEDVEKENIAGRSELRSEIGQLKTLNERLSQDATNLVTALRGSSKMQGDWGEFVLQGLLEASGLREGHEYHAQKGMKDEDGRGARLDVVVNLPGGRHLVIDSKVSLDGYAEYSSGEADDARRAALARHLASVRSHLKGLSAKNYESLHQLTSLDFVVMFVPIEPAFMLALAEDPKLWSEGWHSNVLLAGPSTLLFVIRTVAHLWRQEHQTQNVKQIVKRGGALYDKFVGFVEDLKDVGTRLGQAKDSYDGAFAKLSTGRGNLASQVEMLRKLGVKPKGKTLSAEFAAAALEFGEDSPLQLEAPNGTTEPPA